MLMPPNVLQNQYIQHQQQQQQQLFSQTALINNLQPINSQQHYQAQPMLMQSMSLQADPNSIPQQPMGSDYATSPVVNAFIQQHQQQQHANSMLNSTKTSPALSSTSLLNIQIPNQISPTNTLDSANYNNTLPSTQMPFQSTESICSASPVLPGSTVSSAENELLKSAVVALVQGHVITEGSVADCVASVVRDAVDSQVKEQVDKIMHQQQQQQYLPPREPTPSLIDTTTTRHPSEAPVAFDTLMEDEKERMKAQFQEMKPSSITQEAEIEKPVEEFQPEYDDSSFEFGNQVDRLLETSTSATTATKPAKKIKPVDLDQDDTILLSQLEELEEQIHPTSLTSTESINNTEHFHTSIRAFHQIVKSKLYKMKYHTQKEYGGTKWGLSASRICQLLSCAPILEVFIPSFCFFDLFFCSYWKTAKSYPIQKNSVEFSSPISVITLTKTKNWHGH